MDIESRASFRYRLRSAAKLALHIGDSLLAASQNAEEPTPERLQTLRDLENSLAGSAKHYVPDVLKVSP